MVLQWEGVRGLLRPMAPLVKLFWKGPTGAAAQGQYGTLLIKVEKYIIRADTISCRVAALSGAQFLAVHIRGEPPEAWLDFSENCGAATPPESLACSPGWDQGCRRVRAICRGEG